MLPPTAPAPTPVALDCFAWEGLSATAAAQLAQRLDEAGFAARRSRVDTPNSWWVRVPPQPSREQAERRVQELRQLGVRDTYIVPDSGPTQFAISLGVFKTENRARQLLGQLQAQGVRNAGVEPRMSTTYRVETRLPADQRRSVESAQQGLAARRAACARPD
jgi:cell division septation protein DedD